MTKIQHWHLKNDILAANILANLVALTFFQGLMFRAEPDPPDYIWQIPVVDFIDMFFTPTAFGNRKTLKVRCSAKSGF